MNKKEYVIDGKNFSSLDEFYDEISLVLIPGYSWGRNLDAFNDILRGGFGTPDNGFVIRWKNADLSQENLGFPETIKYIEKKLNRCHPSNINRVQRDLDDAKKLKGQTLFNIIVDIINAHCVGGDEAEDAIELILE